jgi:hypothetical protein
MTRQNDDDARTDGTTMTRREFLTVGRARQRHVRDDDDPAGVRADDPSARVERHVSRSTVIALLLSVMFVGGVVLVA